MSNLTHEVYIQACLEQLKRSGHSLTAARQAVIEAVACSHRALNTAEIMRLAQQRHPDLGRATVFRTLAVLEQMGQVQSVYHPQEGHVYLPAGSLWQGSVICQDCGRVQTIADQQISHLITELEKANHYRVQNHWLQMYGLCGDCYEAERTPTH